MTVHGLFAKMAPRDTGAAAKPHIAIIGRGFSGVMMAIALMKSVRTAFHVHLFDPQPAISGGQVLAAALSGEILNSRVRDLSVAAGQAEDFNDWLLANDEFRSAVSAAIPGFQQIFVPKSIFSDYVYQRFSEALTRRPDISMQLSCQAVLGLRKQGNGRFAVLQEGATVECDAVVLATGFGLRQGEMQVAEEEKPLVRARRLVVPRHTVLLGSGVRVVDRLLQLRDNGFAGEITIVSRHGFLPQPHTRLAAAPTFPVEPMPTRLGDIVRFVRQACEEAEAAGLGWQAAMNGLRRRARSLWQALPQEEKHRFNRHLRSIYDSHRNRLPAPLYLRLRQELTDGRTVLRKGWAGRRRAEGLMVRWAGESQETLLAADQVIDCRCSAPDLGASLMQSLFAGGLAEPDELGLGIAVSPAGEVLVGGQRTRNLYAIGPLGVGSLPDIDLVPEIVTQSYAAARLIATRHRLTHKTG
ncbi:FAD/NAD(P)-binding protein [Ensifer sp.]|uniref:FAD/NAD(P)-binding protein n=1 Tax=Ensifer sp. TaxID=1872086 RepID=UPI002E107042|nr:FAD/NAD(P)-binding protein [Ensifer sp.]